MNIEAIRYLADQIVKSHLDLHAFRSDLQSLTEDETKQLAKELVKVYADREKLDALVAYHETKKSVLSRATRTRQGRKPAPTGKRNK